MAASASSNCAVCARFYPKNTTLPHPNYKYLSDFHPKNAFHIEKYLSHQLKLRLEEEFDAVEVEVSGTSEEEEALLDEWAEELQQQAAESGGLF